MIERIIRVLRGGSWNYTSHDLRASYRNGNEPDHRDDDLGFRLVVRIKDE